MSYSRWSKNSVWYTFWSAICSTNCRFKLPTKQNKNNQCFEICDFPSYYVSYGELEKDGLRKVVKDIQEFYRENNKKTELSDYTNLRWYLVEFMCDVDEHFKWNNFFYYEWYLPSRNEIIWKYRDIKKKLSFRI